MIVALLPAALPSETEVVGLVPGDVGAPHHAEAPHLAGTEAIDLPRGEMTDLPEEMMDLPTGVVALHQHLVTDLHLVTHLPPAKLPKMLQPSLKTTAGPPWLSVRHLLLLESLGSQITIVRLSRNHCRVVFV